MHFPRMFTDSIRKTSESFNPVPALRRQPAVSHHVRPRLPQPFRRGEGNGSSHDLRGEETVRFTLASADRTSLAGLKENFQHGVRRRRAQAAPSEAVSRSHRRAKTTARSTSAATGKCGNLAGSAALKGIARNARVIGAHMRRPWLQEARSRTRDYWLPAQKGPLLRPIPPRVFVSIFCWNPAVP